MNTKAKYIVVLLAALALPLSWASAQTATSASLQFNNNALDTVTGTPETLNKTAGTTFTLSLQIVTNGTTDALDYWLSQFSGPASNNNPFSLVSRDYTGSSYPDPSSPDSQAAASTDTHGNSADTTGADGVADNRIFPHNAFNLGSTAPGGTQVASGTHQVTTFTLQIAANATPGVYQLRTFDYANHGWSDTPNSSFDNAFASQAAININVAVPEPATLSLVGLGGLGALGMTILRRRRVG
jgi:hypothetical protein